MSKALTVPPGTEIKLADFDPCQVYGDYNKESAYERIEDNAQAMANLGYRLYAEDRCS